jgi:DUF4097 and DUF4098 domain-containing protein YvlB
MRVEVCHRIVLLTPLLALVLAGCDITVGKDGVSIDVIGGRASDVWNRTYDVALDGRLEIVNVNGRIEVTGSDGTAIEVSAERVVKANSDDAAKALLATVEMLEHTSPSVVRIEGRLPARQGGTNLEIRYTVKVPRSLGVEVETNNGGVSVNGIDGRVKAASINGGITGRALGGALEASTTNGGIRVELARVDQQTITLATVNGGIDLRVPRSTRAGVDARCTNGSVTVSDLAIETVGERSRRRVEARLNGGGPARIDAETTNGGITIAGTT